MRKLVIIGAGNVGGYLAYNLTDFGSYEMLGFLDDDVNKHNKDFYGHKVLGGVDDIGDLCKLNDLSVAIGIASPVAKCKILERLKKYKIDFPNFIARNVWLSKTVAIGKGVILYPGVAVNYETSIGDFVIMNMNCAIGHNCTIEACSTLAPGVNLAGFTWIEKEVNVGIGVSTRQNIRIGSKAVIGGQSMLTRDITEGSVVAGVPSKKLR